MGIRAIGAVAALAVAVGGIAGGSVAAVAFERPALVIEAAPDAVAAVERMMPVPEVRPATAPSPASAETPAAPGDAIVPATAAEAPASMPAPASCPAPVTGSTAGAPAVVSAGGVAGTSTADLESFAAAYNAQRIAHCLPPVPVANVRYDPCMEQRLFWMAEDPSSDPASAWGHIGSVRSDGVPSVGCDGNLAGGYNNVADTFARKWWESNGHRISLYNPAYAGGMDGVCIYFAVTHGGVPDEPAAFARAAARWGAC